MNGLNALRKIALDFEVFGLVQGVFFRKHTQKKANELGIKGWCRNTRNGTVAGHIQGEPDIVAKMKEWLQTTGSPSSRIDKAEFKNEKELEEFSFQNFSIKQ